MSLTDGTGNMIMPVAPTGGGFGGFGNGDGSWWIILLFILLLGGNNWGNNGGANGYPVAGMIQSGFDQAALTSGLTSIQSAITTGFGDVQNSLCAGFANAEVSANARQIADMQQNFAMQTALTGQLTGLQSQQAQCCCENRAAVADLKYTVATENCADRQAISDGIRDLLTANSANTQRILDQMCQDKIDAKNERIAQLERELTLANLAASQGAQTSAILADNARQTSVLEDYLNPVPRPAYVVQNPNGCGCYQQYGCCGA